MERIDGGSRDSPHCSVPAGEAYTGSDLDDVSRNIEEDFSAALGDFELEREGLEEFESGLEEDEAAHDSDDVPSSAGSERIYGSDGEDLEGIDSDDAVREPDVLDKLSRLATQFTQTVEKLRKKGVGSGKALKRLVPWSKSIGSSRFTPPCESEEMIESTQHDDEEECEEESVASSQARRKRLLAPWRTVMIRIRDDISEEEAFADFAEYATQDLAKAGLTNDVKSRPDDLGGFRKNHVSYFGLSRPMFI
jgi:hypothetical protein